VRRARTLPDKADSRFRRIARTSVADRVAEELMQLIQLRRLGPDEFLPGERQLARLMGVSRASVRGALEQLKRRGLVTATRGGGTRLREPAGEPTATATPAPPDLPIALAGRLLAGAARAALLRPTASLRSELRPSLHALLVPVAATAEPGRAELALYEAIIEAGGNETFRALFDLLRQPLLEWLARVPAAQPAAWRSLAAALEASDGQGVAAIVQGRLDPTLPARPADPADRPAVVRQAAE
jgi:GntR family transcriptional regulator, transcriptional repressor for pyruvate dehydrogenase complex